MLDICPERQRARVLAQSGRALPHQEEVAGSNPCIPDQIIPPFGRLYLVCEDGQHHSKTDTSPPRICEEAPLQGATSRIRSLRNRLRLGVKRIRAQSALADWALSLIYYFFAIASKLRPNLAFSCKYGKKLMSRKPTCSKYCLSSLLRQAWKYLFVISLPLPSRQGI